MKQKRKQCESYYQGKKMKITNDRIRITSNVRQEPIRRLYTKRLPG